MLHNFRKFGIHWRIERNLLTRLSKNKVRIQKFGFYSSDFNLFWYIKSKEVMNIEPSIVNSETRSIKIYFLNIWLAIYNLNILNQMITDYFYLLLLGIIPLRRHSLHKYNSLKIIGFEASVGLIKRSLRRTHEIT